MKRHGNHRPNRDQPAAPTGVPDPPKDLPKRALQEWNQVAPMMAANGLWDEAKRTMLVSYCQAVMDVDRLEAKVQKEGETCLSKRNTVYHNPTVALRDRAVKRVERLFRILMARLPGKKAVAPAAAEASEYRVLMQKRVAWMRAEGLDPDPRSLAFAETGSFITEN